MHGISSHTILDWVKEMAADKYEGRLTGTPSYDAVAAWTADLLQGLEVQAGRRRGHLLPEVPEPLHPRAAGRRVEAARPGSPAAARSSRATPSKTSTTPGSTSDSLSATAEVVYVGFGITAPELGYDDYKGVDVKGKFVAFEPEVPMGPEPDAELFKKWRPYSFHDYKMKNAAAHGAIGVVYNYFIVNPNAAFIKGLQWVAASRAVMDDLFAGTGQEARRGRRADSQDADAGVDAARQVDDDEERDGAPSGGRRVERDRVARRIRSRPESRKRSSSAATSITWA